MKYTIKLLLIIIIIFIGCSKYEDGPVISFRSKKNRLCKKWKLNEFEKLKDRIYGDINTTFFYIDSCWTDTIIYPGTDSCCVVHQIICTMKEVEFFPHVVEFKDNNVFIIYKIENNKLEELNRKYWKFTDNNEKIKIHSDNSEIIYTILRLKDKELWIENEETELNYIKYNE